MCPLSSKNERTLHAWMQPDSSSTMLRRLKSLNLTSLRHRAVHMTASYEPPGWQSLVIGSLVQTVDLRQLIALQQHCAVCYLHSNACWLSLPDLIAAKRQRQTPFD